MKALPLAMLALFVISAAAIAAEPDRPPAVEPAPGAGGFLEAPQVAPSPVTADAVEPDITIRSEGEQLIYEYRVNGHLYMVKIQPQIGPPYYLIDTNGDGVMDIRDNSPRDINIPQWVLFTWD